MYFLCTGQNTFVTGCRVLMAVRFRKCTNQGFLFCVTAGYMIMFRKSAKQISGLIKASLSMPVLCLAAFQDFFDLIARIRVMMPRTLRNVTDKLIFITSVTMLVCFNSACRPTLHSNSRQHQRICRHKHDDRGHTADNTGQQLSRPAVVKNFTDSGQELFHFPCTPYCYLRRVL